MMTRIKQKMKQIISFTLVFLMIINSLTVLGYSVEAAETGTEITGQLLKDNELLTDEDTISINDNLSWRVTVDKNDLEGGVTITLPDGVLPDIPSGGLEGLTVTVSGNEVTVKSSNTETATGPAVTATVTETQLLDIPCKIDASKVSNGKINIAGTNLNITNSVQVNMVTPDSIELLKKTSAGESSITSGSAVSMNDSFILRMNWKSLLNVKAGDYYEFELPEEFGVPSSDGSAKIKAQNVQAGFPDLPFATMSWKAGSNKLYIEFMDMGKYTMDGVEYDALSLLGDASMDYECKLDDNLVADEQGKITIDLLSDSVTITVSELVPKAPMLNKAVGTWNAQGEVEWTVTYTHPVEAYTGDKPTKLIDSLPLGMIYLENEVSAMVNGVDKTSWIKYEDNKLICDLTDIQGGQTLKLTYKTKLIDGELQNIWISSNPNNSYTNKIVAKVGDADAKGVQGNSTATVSVNNWSGSTMIKKDGNAIAPTGGETEWKIKWEVTVQTASRNFKNLTLIDNMGKGLTLVESSVEVVNQKGIAVSANKAILPRADGKTTMILELVKEGVPTTSEETYKITYTTIVKQEYFDQTSDLTDDTIRNNAELKYEWPDGSGISGIYSPPGVSKKPDGINNTLIEKSGFTYDKKDHSLLWEVKVNPNKVNLTEIELVDDLTSLTPKHSFVPGESTEVAIVDEIEDIIEAAVKEGMTNAGVSTTVKDSVDVELVGKKLSIKISNLGKSSFKFQMKTYASDPSFYAGNADETFKNTIIMTKAGTKVDGTTISSDVSASATIQASSTVLKKNHLSYDPITKKITWQLIINANETNLGNVTITDKLVDGLTCNVSEARLNGGNFTSGNTFEVDESSNIITINLKDVKSQQMITFTTTVDVDTDAFRTKDKVDITNTAKLTSQTNPKVVESNITLTLSNKALSKTAVKNDQNLTADYTVKLNPLGLDLLKGLPAGQKLQLEDTLPDGLYLDLDSVKLYKAGTANASKSGNTYTVNMTTGEIVDTVIDYDPATRTLTVDIPEASQGYILTYKTFIVRTGVDLKNNIRLVGSVLPDNSSIKNTYNSMKVASNGNAKIILPKTSFLSVQIKKVNNSGNSLDGASFGLYVNKTDSLPLVSAICDSATGICTLAIPRSKVKDIKKLYWKEIVAPTGYELSSEWHEVDVANHDPEIIFNVINVPTGDATSAQIKMIKKDSKDSSKVLANAVFEIYTDKECTLPVQEGGKPLTSTSDSNGIITFTGLYPEQSYYVREQSAPDGYVRSEQIIKVVAKKTWAVSDIPVVSNEKAEVTLNVIKVDALDLSKKLSGAEFQLYADENCTIKVGETQTTIADGSLEFTGLFPDHTYYLKEISAPIGYNIIPDIYTITTGDNGVSVSKQIGNYLIGWNEKASLKITKTNEDGTKLLSGASFALYAQDKATLLGEQSTDGDGVCSFLGLSKGTYYVRETGAPDGYVLLNDWIEVSLDVNEAVQLTIKNVEIPPVKPTDPTDPTNPTDPTEPTNPTDPTEPTNPTNPTNPTDPTEPTEPTKPTDPTEPTKPTDPTKPTEPTKPTKPTNPDGSDNTKDPTVPVNPQEPEKPKDGSESNNGKDNESPNNSKNGKDEDNDKSDLNQKEANNRDGNQDDSQSTSNSSLPKTGVKSHYVLWSACIIFSCFAAIGLVVFWKRQNKRINVKQIASKKDKSSDHFK